MRRALTALVVLVAAAAVLAAVASARTASTKQHVNITETGNSFVLRAASSGAIKDDKGAMAACCWTRRFIDVVGQSIEVDNPRLTLTGAKGTLTFRNRIEWVNLPGGLGVFSGTWKVIGGTGGYAGVTGQGRVVGVQPASQNDKAHFFGYLESS
jgi:hypothetical protein